MLSIIISLAVLFKISASDKVYAFRFNDGKDCQGTGSPRDLLRNFVGNAQECMAKCSELDCGGFIRVNTGSYAGKCFFRNGLGPVRDNPYGDDRDCYEPIAAYTKHEGLQCWGSGNSAASDVLRDFEGTAEECALECHQRSDCVGFVRVNTVGKCYLRGGVLQAPIPNQFGDDRDCFEPTTLSSAVVGNEPFMNENYNDYNDYNDFQYPGSDVNDGSYTTIMISSNTVMVIGGLLIVLLIGNIVCMGYLNFGKGNEKRIQYKRVKYETASDADLL